MFPLVIAGEWGGEMSCSDGKCVDLKKDCIVGHIVCDKDDADWTSVCDAIKDCSDGSDESCGE